MLYLANASSPAIREAMSRQEIGMLATPTEGRSPEPTWIWGADNACFGKKKLKDKYGRIEYVEAYPGDQAYLRWLKKHARFQRRCLFANAPDVVGDATLTLLRSRPMLPLIRELGYRAALVAQDGLELLPIPWDEFDVLFLGGSTEWKLSTAAYELGRRARIMGKHVHMGRVNSFQRLLYATSFCDTADGTYLTFGPTVNLRKLRNWMDALLDYYPNHRSDSCRILGLSDP